jgi:hypothetical protein
MPKIGSTNILPVNKFCYIASDFSVVTAARNGYTAGTVSNYECPKKEQLWRKATQYYKAYGFAFISLPSPLFSTNSYVPLMHCALVGTDNI